MCFPFKYKQFTRWTAVVGAEVALFVLITLLWLIDFITRVTKIITMFLLVTVIGVLVFISISVYT